MKEDDYKLHCFQAPPVSKGMWDRSSLPVPSLTVGAWIDVFRRITNAG